MINPHSIIDKEFGKQLRGYNTEEVDEFLDDLVIGIQEIYKENATLKAKFENLEHKLARYETMEKSIQDTLIMAQSAAQGAKEQATKEAESIIKEARQLSSKLSQNAEVEHANTLTELQRSKIEFESYRRRILNFMESQMLSFDAMTKDLGATKIENLGLLNGETTVYDFEEINPMG